MEPEPNAEPRDVPPPTPQDEEVVDPTIPAGNTEQVTIRRHPFGLIALYIEAFIGLIAAFSLVFLLVPALFGTDNQNRAVQIISLLGVVVFALIAIFLLIATAIYRQNRWIVNDDGVTQILQTGLFRRQTSELSMANIEDVTAEQNGLLPTLLGYGTLKCETAGERSNFHFIYCPKPNIYAKIILDARERYIESNPERANRANDPLNTRGEFKR